MRTWTLNCIESNDRHTKFAVFDPHGANCGTLTVLTSDVSEFAANFWNGDIQWNGHFPAPKKGKTP